MRIVALGNTGRGRAGYWLFGASLAVWLVTRLTVSWPGFYDLSVYRAEGLAVRTGGELYGQLSDTSSLATYPPFAALLFVPLSSPPVFAVHVAVFVANLLLLLVVCDLSCRLVGVRDRSVRPAACALAAVALWCEPVYVAMNYGQIDLLLLALVLADVVLLRRTPGFGIGIGLAVAIKVTPGVFVLYLLLTRRWRAAAVACGTFALTVAASAAVDAGGTWRFWTGYLFQLERVGRVENNANQSLHGLAARALAEPAVPLWIGLGVMVALVAGVVFAARVHDRLGDGVGVVTCAVAALLCAPIAWSHHWVWCVPVVALVCVRTPAWAPALAVFWTYTMWLLPGRHELDAGAWETAASACYVAVGVLFLVLVAVELRRERRWQRWAAVLPDGRPAVSVSRPAAVPAATGGCARPVPVTRRG